jgi:hypothetical protein
MESLPGNDLIFLQGDVGTHSPVGTWLVLEFLSGVDALTQAE